MMRNLRAKKYNYSQNGKEYVHFEPPYLDVKEFAQ